MPEVSYHDKKKFDKETKLIQDNAVEEKLKSAIQALENSSSYECLNKYNLQYKEAGGFYDKCKLYEIKLNQQARLFFCFKDGKWCITQLDLTHSVNKQKHRL